MNNSYQEWINRAKSCLALAKEFDNEDIYREDLCFQAQQAAEKAVKAVMVYLSIEPPHTHNFNVLLLRLKEKISIPDYILKVIDLNDYAIQTRYPGDYTPVGKAEYEEVVRIAESVVAWASDFVNDKK